VEIVTRLIDGQWLFVDPKACIGSPKQHTLIYRKIKQLLQDALRSGGG
jgi:hypothetical protein